MNAMNPMVPVTIAVRSEEHTSELQSRSDLVCRLLLEKKKKIKFVGLGEKYDALEGFYPERIVSRVLGMCDIMSLIERMEQNVDRTASAEIEVKLRNKE